MASRASSRSSRRKTTAQSGLTRARMVWVSFLGAMTVVGGLLLLVRGGPVPRSDGVPMSALAATTLGSPTDTLTQTRTAIVPARWNAIVIHHSNSIVGSATSIGKEHESAGMPGLGHHFIIGNGNGMDDGLVHIGYRWLDQVSGQHAAGQHKDFYDREAISICLVGDGNRRPFTQAQMAALQNLVKALQQRLDLPGDRVLLASDIAKVEDPGRLFPAGMYGRGGR